MMANLVNLESVGKAYVMRTLLDEVSLGVAEGDRIGVVGRNGDGKTTLIRVMAQREPVDSGRVTHVGGLSLGILSQQDDLDPTATVRQEIVGDRPEHEWAGDARIRDVLTGLFGGLAMPGFESGIDSVIGPLSGGERRRIALAKLLIGEHDLIILDEPTNHLDVEGIAWLAGHLKARRSALVVVTHDRWFLDEVCTRTWDVQGGKVHDYEGGYSAYVLARAERSRIASTEETKRQNLVRKELAWLRRGAPARTSKPKFRIEAANELIADEPPPRDTLALRGFANARLGKTVFELLDVRIEAGPKTLLEHLTWNLGPGDRIGLVGVNGAGKTSLLRALKDAAYEEKQPAAGKVVVGRTVKLAYLSQEVTELPPALRVLEAVSQIRERVEIGKGKELTAGQLCEQFGFTGEKQWTPVSDLSGGERRRLQLLRLLMDEPNVLFMDEPTNDLDIETLTQLEDLLDGWPGSLVIVSHDRYFIERTTDTVLALLGDRTLRMLPGGIEEYLKRRRAAVEADVPAAPTRRGGGDTRAAKKELQRVERQLSKLVDREKKVHDGLAEHATDFDKVSALDAELRAIRDERDQLEMRWLELAEETE
ncbi:ABC-F family ATP-binding cassette domain-containing protein [Embleya sp. NBC_00896]|uniref:ABC-F family ATP-binding cassette domain-containing protein n=1 Tax=Embleya sp. NBC_00896 TaxID=2975961 RepID=UPI00386D8E97|nr:ABC-F family ATP-binding cassette domain-containing protein [Embleya sp. NBC_00896]